MRKAILAVLLGLTIFFATSASGAVITVSTDPDDHRLIINVEGVLTSNDGDTFRKITAELHSGSALVSFNSGGGDLVTGIQMGEIIRQHGLDTTIRDGKECASACALAWLAGTKRFIEGTAGIGFHAAYEAASGRETGVGNALVGAYVTKLGLSYSAVIYITKAAPNEMTWLNMSDAARLGINVAFARPTARKPVLTLPTRFGDVEIVKLADDSSEIRFKSSRIKIFLNENDYSGLEGIVRVSAGDLLIISTPSNVRGMPPSYYAILVTPQSVADIGGDRFTTEDDTFRFEQVGDEVRFDLGYENKQKKNAIYRNGTITVMLQAQSSSATLPKEECARVLNMAAECPKIESGCSDEAIWDKFAMSGQRYFNSLENMPVFSTENFYRTCRAFCASKTYSLKAARPLLCGY